MKRTFISAVVLACTAAVAFGGVMKKRTPAAAPAPARQPARQVAKPAAVRPAASASRPAAAKPAAKPAARPAAMAPGYRAAGTVAFANLETIARTVEGIAGKGSNDMVLTRIVPNAIRGQGAAKLFGAMRPGAHGVAVCYVDPAVAARVAASKRPSDADLDRVKRWSVVYPTTMTAAAFRSRHPDAVPEANGSIKVMPGAHSRRTLWAWFAPDGKWAVLAPAPSMAVHAYGFSAAARGMPLGNNLAYIQMDEAGTRALLGADLFAGGAMAVRMTPAGLELAGYARQIAMQRPPLPRGALSLAGVPANAPLFGVTTTPEDVRTAEDIFAMAGPELGAFVRQSLKYLRGNGSTGYYLDGTGAPAPGLAPSARLLRILPEAKTLPATANAMFCSPTIVLRQCLPIVAKKLMPMESAKFHVGLRLLRGARGEGMGCMSWKDGNLDHLLIRISRDELYGTANLWSSLFL